MLHLRNDPPLPPLSLLTHAALFLDFDGTLVEIAPRPDLVRVDDRLAGLLPRLADRLSGRLAIVSGRPADEIARLLGDPALAIAGSHGLEFRHADGRRTAAERPGALDQVQARFEEFAAHDADLLVEDKPLGVALHYRLAPHREAAAEALAAGLAAEHGLHLQRGKMMVEVRSGAGDKGRALAALMREPAMAPARPLFAGDDETDEAGFEMARDLGGHGILIGEARPTAATHRLPTVAALLDWLEAGVSAEAGR